MLKLLRGEVGIPAAQQGHDGALPGKVDKLLMSKQRISAGGAAEKKEAQQKSGRQGPEEMAHLLTVSQRRKINCRFNTRRRRFHLRRLLVE